ncbi:MAG: CooT family nickel-binding protein [Thermodesulfobacteriota bacterium]
MCEASAFVLKNGREELLLADVDIIEPDGEDLRLVNIFGEQIVIKADIQRLNLVNHKIILVER